LKVKKQSWKKIIIFRQGRIGDTLVAFPLIQALKKLFPSARLVYCTQNYRNKKHLQGHDVTDLSPYIDSVVSYNFEDSVIKKYQSLKRGLNPGKEDLLIYLPYNRVRRYQILRDWLFFKMLNFKHMICFKENWDWTYFYDRKQNKFPKEHNRMFDFVRKAGIPVDFSGNCSLKYDAKWADDKLNEWGINRKEFLAVCPGSKMQSKLWPEERYILVGKEWHKRTGMPLIIVGGPNESDVAEHIVKQWAGYGFSICGASIEQTAALLSKASMYCGNDTGCMHLAAILGIPCVAIFSARESRKLWYPMNDKHIVLKEDMDCEGCHLEKCYTNPSKCLDKITIDKVLESLSEIYECSKK